ncbi:hypothetical protein CARUB_v10018621mg [Capsella rubella]|uniref:At1g61320/AtMIF1 LRR domain-containing protein n=1 Tax=Capsella rubella TaxID=81985 RepID=R0FRR1_9BRAS|nr:hypothetical protein CARUB_v10018621mg [Capsella rubella]
MAESSNKMMKLTQKIPDDMVEHIISMFLPIKSLLRNRILSKRFVNTNIQSRNLDFSGILSRRRSQLEAVSIIEEVFNKYKGSDIHRFVLLITHLGVEDKIISWINTCFGKNIQEIFLDFSKSKKVMEIPINFSAVETLQDLKLRSCKFEMLENSPKGLRLLRTLSLMRTEVMKETIDAVFSNCIHLESLELIECRMDGLLSIHAQNHKKFKLLILSSIQDLWDIILDAPSPYTLKEANLHYNRNFSRRYYDPSNLVLNNMNFLTRVFVLTTTTIFLEALTKKYVGGGKLEKWPFKFENLTKFHISFKAPTFCTLFDIAEFLKECPKLEHVAIDIYNFTFEPQLPLWESHHKDQIQNDSKNNYVLKFLKKVKIFGYKGHSHELDIVEFFVKSAPSLVKLRLVMPKNAKDNAHAPDNARIEVIRNIFSGIKVTEV